MSSRSLVAAALAVVGVVSISSAQLIGPSAGGQTPYVLPVAPGGVTYSMISNGGGSATYNGTPLTDVTYTQLDASNNPIAGSAYRMSGIPDGMGAYDNGDGTFTVLLNHELGATAGRNTALGTPGAFVSLWTINKSDFSVIGGRDLITQYQPNPSDNSTIGSGNTSFARFCSADLPAQSALQFGNFGTTSKLFFNGEETGSEGRGVAIDVGTGIAYNLPHSGKFSWENNVPNPLGQQKTIVAGLDDSGDGQVYFYVGDKKQTGTGANPVDDAGLVGGNLYGLRIPMLDNNSGGTNREGTSVPAATFSGTRFEMHNFGDVSGITGAALEAASDTNQVTQFARAEDGAWHPDPARANEFYFVTTTSSRLFRATFDDIANPALGGRIDVLVDTGVGAQADDNITVSVGADGKTYVLIQEDGGTGPDEIWMYNVDDDTNTLLAAHDSQYSFANGAESSGIIPAPFLARPGMPAEGWFIYNSQASAGFNSTFPDTFGLVSGGQVQVGFFPQAIPEPATLGLLASGAVLALRRR
jgi:hypothetical protein